MRPHLAIFGCKLIIDQVNHYVEFNEYPQTSETGVVTVYDVSAWEPEEARKAFALKNIQYSIGDPGNKKSIFSNCQFLGVDTTKEYRTCQGVKACEYASQELHTPHTEVDFEGQLFKRLFDAHEYSISKQTLGYVGRVLVYIFIVFIVFIDFMVILQEICCSTQYFVSLSESRDKPILYRQS